VVMCRNGAGIAGAKGIITNRVRGRKIHEARKMLMKNAEWFVAGPGSILHLFAVVPTAFGSIPSISITILVFGLSGARSFPFFLLLLRSDSGGGLPFFFFRRLLPSLSIALQVKNE